MSTVHPNPPSSANAAVIVAEREIVSQVTSKSFIVSTIVTLVLVLGSIIASSFFADDAADALGPVDPSDKTKVAVVAATSQTVGDVPTLAPVVAASEDEARALVADESVEAAVLPGPEPSGLLVVTLTGTNDEIMRTLAVVPATEELEPAATTEGVRYLVSLAFGIVFMMIGAGSGGMIAQSTVSEKQTRVVEILLATVSARSLLAGKILGNTVLALGQAAAIAATAVLGLVITGQDELLGMLGAPILWFVAFLVVGFLLLAAIYAAGASLVSRVEDTGSVIMPAMMLTMIPYFLVVFLNENEVVMTILSYVPFSAPVGMPVRLFFGEAQWWEPLVAIVILLATAYAVTAVAARIYSGSLLRTGPRVSVRDALASSSREAV
ncbi:ABC-2 type transport system permease protein [Flavimobilis soli]|uniref:ABC-2 type transport system permease protein n=1 Tax=Flavimobilis soli TaxID=442709 RepID=A0A2A9EB25_9MICO|nr:ABC transporter permease [Flavimobilis soli]PFG35410.1 ABC-2 type transport system permease protein [Flavimobilis soli]